MTQIRAFTKTRAPAKTGRLSPVDGREEADGIVHAPGRCLQSQQVVAADHAQQQPVSVCGAEAKRRSKLWVWTQRWVHVRPCQKTYLRRLEQHLWSLVVRAELGVNVSGARSCHEGQDCRHDVTHNASADGLIARFLGALPSQQLRSVRPRL